MKRVLVSILSQQSVPNYLFIKEMEGEYDDLLFITSQDVETKMKSGELIESSLRLPPLSVRRIQIEEDNFSRALEKFNQANISKENSYLVNITGGTKVMSLATMEFFKSLGNSRFYYLPIKKNSYHYIDKVESYPIQYSLSIKEYFQLCGIRITPGELMKSQKEAYIQFEKIKNNNNVLPEELRPEIVQTNFDLNAEDADYYSGSWFEDYVYFRIKNELKLLDEQIAVSVKIHHKNVPIVDNSYNDHELDVAFIYNNELHVIECKVSLGKNKNFSTNMEKAQYKLAAISREYGLQVNPYIFALQDLNSIDSKVLDNIKKRNKILGIKKVYYTSDILQDTLNIK